MSWLSFSITWFHSWFFCGVLVAHRINFLCCVFFGFVCVRSVSCWLCLWIVYSWLHLSFLCCVLFGLRSVSCAQCCPCLWIVLSGLPNLFSLIFVPQHYLITPRSISLYDKKNIDCGIQSNAILLYKCLSQSKLLCGLLCHLCFRGCGWLGVLINTTECHSMILLQVLKANMKLSPRELESLLVHQAGCVAQRRLARGLRLNHPETMALIASQVCTQNVILTTF
jgi:hypothetical protein